ncbi:hypothetical protein BDV95DRAFT_638991 [Massariosphaeria phaeospora]|uniref:Uncharacterized protein n=1 Tax=Massariosphaeria phaeospora TaxID=100035 RepID=A0A7C8I8N2_9PLEO|nr:hypothetical protein BDV95DRAFT_638991 [Massariosphaeria phaeospora]
MSQYSHTPSGTFHQPSERSDGAASTNSPSGALPNARPDNNDVERISQAQPLLRAQTDDNDKHDSGSPCEPQHPVRHEAQGRILDGQSGDSHLSRGRQSVSHGAIRNRPFSLYGTDLAASRDLAAEKLDELYRTRDGSDRTRATVDGFAPGIETNMKKGKELLNDAKYKQSTGHYDRADFFIHVNGISLSHSALQISQELLRVRRSPLSHAFFGHFHLPINLFFERRCLSGPFVNSSFLPLHYIQQVFQVCTLGGLVEAPVATIILFKAPQIPAIKIPSGGFLRFPCVGMASAWAPWLSAVVVPAREVQPFFVTIVEGLSLLLLALGLFTELVRIMSRGPAFV